MRANRLQLIGELGLARNYGVRVVPTIIIDGEVKIEGRPDSPFVCSDETYAHFKKRYPLTFQLTRPSDAVNSTLYQATS